LDHRRVSPVGPPLPRERRRGEVPEGRLDPDCLAVLANALEEAGATDPSLLNHLRLPGLHVRGCWAIDWVLGKH
jgi:hypothetical protein